MNSKRLNVGKIFASRTDDFLKLVNIFGKIDCANQQRLRTKNRVRTMKEKSK
ncbi:MAG TPA: hypothetical protein VEL11_15205 [Candidatus Bathyarchaeia archaeon]|nr:hypothetical protein [Candidatus Bathyarchaeia archaeon]